MADRQTTEEKLANLRELILNALDADVSVVRHQSW